jgi:hypothetical protein
LVWKPLSIFVNIKLLFWISGISCIVIGKLPYSVNLERLMHM